MFSLFRADTTLVSKLEQEFVEYQRMRSLRLRAKYIGVKSTRKFFAKHGMVVNNK